MAEITYTLNEEIPQDIPGFEQYQNQDLELLDSFQINNLFDPTKNFSELHILDLADTLLSSTYSYTGYRLSLDAQSAGKEGASVLTIDPIQDALSYGYSFGGVKLLYHFLNDLYTSDNNTLDFYVDSISPDRTELQLLTNNLTAEDVVRYTEAVNANLRSQSYFSEFRLNFKDNNLLIGLNIDNLDTVNGKAVVVKLYEPLPDNFTIKSKLSIVEVISDSVAYELDYEEALDTPTFPALRSANFNLDIQDENVIPTQYFNYDELLSYKVGNTNSEIYSLINEKGVELSIDYSDYSNFIHFSSAQERLLNFKYKIDLLARYSQSLSTKGSATGGSSGVSGSVAYYEGLYQGIINNFDHYERFLYYESGSSSWPKVNNAKPYINQASSLATTWYNSALTAAVAYDSTNYNSLIETIPAYLKDDPANDNYLTFVYMVGQHFDNLWVYGNAVTDKYNNDNRLNYGISKDLVGEALKNFGVKLYTSNKSIEDLFSTFIGQAYQSGSEQISSYITGSLTGSNTPIQPTSFDNYQKEIQKRIYHNLPLLLKSKGTERGLRALINCFGIPSDVLDIKLYGGKNTYKLPLFGDSQYVTSSLDKIRLDNTGSIVEGSTLSEVTSIIKRDDRYTDDLHTIEVGFSPTDNIDNYIISRSAATFSIDDYLGDPRNLTSERYSGLSEQAYSILGNLNRYNLQDYVRLIKFFDNTVFKMVKDFIPARSVGVTGVVIKPNLLNISKAKSVSVTGTRSEYTGSIDTAFTSASNAGMFKKLNDEWSTSYVDRIQTPTDYVVQATQHNQEQPKYNGELSGSRIAISSRDLNKDNPYKNSIYIDNSYDTKFVSSSEEVCNLTILAGLPDPLYLDPRTPYRATDFFSGIDPRTTYSASNGSVSIPFSPTYTSIPLENPYSLTGLGLNQYDYFYIKANNWDKSPSLNCNRTVTSKYGICDIQANGTIANGSTVVRYVTYPGSEKTYPVSSWFSFDPIQTQVQFTASWEGNQVGIPTSDLTNYKFTQPANTEVTITAIDVGLGQTCKAQLTLTVSNRSIGVAIPSSGFPRSYAGGDSNLGYYVIDESTYSPGQYGFEFEYSYYDAAYGSTSGRVDLFVPYVPYRAAYLGGQNMRVGSSPNADNLGIQAFFTPQTKDLYENNDIRYNIYQLNYVATPYPPYYAYNIVKKVNTWNEGQSVPLQNLNPNDYDTNFNSAQIACRSSQKEEFDPTFYLYDYQRELLTFTCENYLDARSVSATNYDQNGNWPITIQTPPLIADPVYTQYCPYGDDWDLCDPNSENYTGPAEFNIDVPSPSPATELVQAFILEATEPGGDTARVTVYGQKYFLQAVEGTGDVLTYIPPPLSSEQTVDGGYLLVGWDYSNGTSPAGLDAYPNINDPQYGPWIFVKARRFSTT